MMNRERGNILIIIIGVALILVLLGFFKTNKIFWETLNFKSILRLPCGLTIQHPDPKVPEKVAFPLTVDGYANGCGWDVSTAHSVGKAQVFDNVGAPITAPIDLLVDPNSTDTPFSFSATLKPITSPHTDKGNIIITSTTGLISTVEISF